VEIGPEAGIFKDLSLNRGLEAEPPTLSRILERKAGKGTSGMWKANLKQKPERRT
jgi:hypothetical protein